jgi:hypothetical protein
MWDGIKRALRQLMRPSLPLLHSLLHTNCCKQVQEDEIQNDKDFSSIKPKMKWGRWELVG